jgi:hypothetical protein
MHNASGTGLRVIQISFGSTLVLSTLIDSVVDFRIVFFSKVLILVDLMNNDGHNSDKN